ncbi:MAG: hypothetical protein JRI68_09765 [Deltaproteobacteria bacterium]|nr:hypothetical protein [Deltaproteobacteria bacterium]
MSAWHWFSVLSVVGCAGLLIGACSSDDENTGFGGGTTATGTGGDGGAGASGGSSGTAGGGAVGGSSGTAGGGAVGGSSGTAGSGGAGGSSGTGGGAGGAPCEANDCPTCMQSQCATDYCSTEIATCQANQDCADLYACITLCPNQTCSDGCHQLYPNGITDLYAVTNCAACDSMTCAQHCGPVCPLAAPTPSTCDVGDCNTCTGSQCAADTCALPLQTCQQNINCVDLYNCLNGCGTQVCENSCHVQHQNGIADLYGAIDCLACHPASCSTDCAQSCPVTPPTIQACNVGDCQTCATSQCAAAQCANEIATCQGNQACQNLYQCYQTCTVPGCYTVCDGLFPAGVTDVTAMLQCLQCNQATCSIDCANNCS